MRRFAHFLICLLVAGSLSAQTRTARRPLEPPPPPEPYNQLDSSQTLFYVLAAVNAAGYDEQANSSTNSPLRGRALRLIISPL